MKTKKIAVQTLGCKVNQYDSDSVVDQFRRAGYELVDFDDQADVYIVNTCTVTSLGDKKSRQMVRRARRTNPDGVVVMMGCFAQASPEEAAAVEGVNLVIGTDQRGGMVPLVEQLTATEHQTLIHPIFDVKTFEELPVENIPGRSRAVLKIQDGCNEFCSYCKIPFARGHSRSRSVDNVVEQARILVDKGFGEIVLTGIHLGAYGRDLGDGIGLAEVMEAIVDRTTIKRLRLSSIDPDKVDQRLLSFMATSGVVCRHFHVPLQSGSSAVLKRMRRNYSAEEYRDVIRRIRDCVPDAAITTDIIVGFPGETEAEFEETVTLTEEIGFSRLHVFPFSARQGTPAARMEGQIPKTTKNQRVERLSSLGHDLAMRYHKSLVGKAVTILVENSPDGHLIGFTDDYVRVQAPKPFPEQSDLEGAWAVVEIMDANSDGVAGICRDLRKS